MAKKMDIQRVWTRGEHEGFTAYMVATIVNVELANRGLEEIRPQMMYNYDKNGLINGTKGQNALEREGKLGYTTEEVIAFANKFADMRQAKAANAPAPKVETVEDIDALVAELLAKKSELQGTTNA
jgi:hypothetical protein